MLLVSMRLEHLREAASATSTDQDRPRRPIFDFKALTRFPKVPYFKSRSISKHVLFQLLPSHSFVYFWRSGRLVRVPPSILPLHECSPAQSVHFNVVPEGQQTAWTDEVRDDFPSSA